jgi:glutathione S-transferase
MKLYHCPDARSLRPLWALEEMKLEYDLINMPFPPRASYPGYLNLNPMGTVPTFIDGDTTITESSGICHYLAENMVPLNLAFRLTTRLMVST